MVFIPLIKFFERLWKHPQTCFKYVQCAPGYGVEHQCPKGTIYDERIRNCNWFDQLKTCPECECYTEITETTKAPITVAPTGKPVTGKPVTGNDHCPEHEVLGK